MATLEDIRRIALSLPGAQEVDWLGRPSFQIGSKGFVHTVKDGIVMKLAKPHQELLFEARPDVFRPMIAGALRWSFVDIAALDAEEVAVLVVEAWSLVAPKKVSRAFLAGA